MNGQTHAFPSGRPAAHAPWWGARGRGLAGEQPLQHAGSRRSPTFSACRSQTSMCLFLGSSFCCWSRSSFSAVLSLPPSPLVADMPGEARKLRPLERREIVYTRPRGMNQTA